MSYFVKALFLFIIVLGMQSCYAQFAVVVGAKSEVAAMSADQVASLFLGKTDKFPNGSTALLLDQSSGSAIRNAFYDKVTGKNEAQIKAGWSRLVFSGKGTPPKEISGSQEVKKLVSANLNAVGYIEKSAVDASVKVLLSVD
ncbi:phosphate ABC transporter substrate-binding protein [Solimicrobium silvestre]|uniref:Phosphate ABC transporter substrate-binding protein n=1 Tax=Solimicrobium silvestre TaxID=2099400 RepID=A0A2S9GSX4_9BURK|nr:phosphate ABC transporter substrate-binding protein [Solimicrobium silvestre]PRC90813.1 hypothetical protein S2091_4476 [Solimicrobium silvestre]